MIKIIIAGVWACAVTLAASYAAVSLQASSSPKAAPEPEPERLYGGLETVRTRMISVPIIRAGALQGYAVAQFTFTVDAKTLKRLSVKPELVVLDEAFKAIYSDEAVDFRQMRKQDLPDLAKRIVEGANKRYGTNVVDDAFLQEFNYISKDGIRGGGK
jgi:hypothetical protein